MNFRCRSLISAWHISFGDKRLAEYGPQQDNEFIGTGNGLEFMFKGVQKENWILGRGLFDTPTTRGISVCDRLQLKQPMKLPLQSTIECNLLQSYSFLMVLPYLSFGRLCSVLLGLDLYDARKQRRAKATSYRILGRLPTTYCHLAAT